MFLQFGVSDIYYNHYLQFNASYLVHCTQTKCKSEVLTYHAPKQSTFLI